jgi:opacity protein-like surface antigen
MDHRFASCLLGLVIAVVLIVGLPECAAAQDQKVDVAGGYSYSQVPYWPDWKGSDVPRGWFASVGGYLTPLFGIVGEVNGAYKTSSLALVGGRTFEEKDTIHYVMFGPKVRSRQGPARGFAQFLVGARMTSFDSSSSDGGAGFSASSTHFAIAPGGGVDVKVSDNLGVRLGANLKLTTISGEWFKLYQVNVGLVWGR